MDSAFLGLFAFLAGFIDAVVGGGGLIQIPALFAFLPGANGLPVGVILGTNKLSSACGTALAALQYSRRIAIPWRDLLPASGAAFVASFIGARTVVWLSSAVLKPIILTLLVAVAIYTFRKKDFGKLHAPALTAARAKVLGIAVGLGIGFYDGFFGPGTGSFLIFIFIGLFGFDFLRASGSAKVINLATNLSAILYFAVTGNILYHYALPMAALNMAGSLAGTRLAIWRGNRLVRAVFLVVVTTMIARFGWELWRTIP